MNKTPLFLIIALVLIVSACNRRNTKIQKSVSYTGDMMHIKVYAKIDGKEVQDFEQEYDVTGLSKPEKEAMAKRIMDSVLSPDKAVKPR